MQKPAPKRPGGRGIERLEGRVLLAVYFVDPDYVPGDGGSADGSFARPFTTAVPAVDLALPGDMISLRSDTVQAHARIVVRRGGVTFNSYTVDPADSSRPVFNVGRARVVAGASAPAAMQIMASEWVGYQPTQAVANITVENLDLSGGYYALKIEGRGPRFDDAKNVLIRNCNLHHSRHDVVKVTPGANYVTIERCDIHHSNQSRNRRPNAEGVDVVNGDYFTLRNSHIWSIATNGVYAKGGSRHTLIEGNRIERVAHHGIILGQSTDAMWFHPGTRKRYESILGVARDNVVVDAGGAGIGFWGAYKPQAYNNTLINVAKSLQGGILITAERGVPTVSPRLYNNLVQIANAKLYTVKVLDGGMSGVLKAGNNRYVQRGNFFIDGRTATSMAGWRKAAGVATFGTAGIRGDVGGTGNSSAAEGE